MQERGMLRAFLIACIAALLLLAFPFIRKEIKFLDSKTRAYKSLLAYEVKEEVKRSLADSSIFWEPRGCMLCSLWCYSAWEQ